VVEQYKNGLIYLYNKELRSNPTFKGTISVEFSIDSSGKVIETRIVSTTMDHAPLEQALASRRRDLPVRVLPGVEGQPKIRHVGPTSAAAAGRV
jgi:hypothetical protein